MQHHPIEDISARFGAYSDAQWLALLQRSITEEEIEGVRFPRFPKENIQRNFVGAANEHALKSASQFYTLLKNRSASLGNPLGRDSSVLDFGCGWGRFLRFFWKDVPPAQIFGVDVDPGVLQLCRDLGLPGSFSTIEPGGRLPFEDGAFTHIMAYSVFTHLPEAVHLHWPAEIARVLRRGGTFILTLQPRRFLDFVAGLGQAPQTAPWQISLSKFSQEVPRRQEAFDRGELVYFPSGGGNYRGPEVYGDAIVPKSFIERHWRQLFEVHEYLDDSTRFQQAILVARRR